MRKIFFKKILVVALSCMLASTTMLTACVSDDYKAKNETTAQVETTEAETTVAETTVAATTAAPKPKTSTSKSSSSTTSSSKKSYTHTCEECSKEGTKSIKGISGRTEWYCKTHYDEMMDIIGYMEKTVGSGKASKHTCEVCSKEGTKSIKGISGSTEYYCTAHYNEMVEILNMIMGK